MRLSRSRTFKASPFGRRAALLPLLLISTTALTTAAFAADVTWSGSNGGWLLGSNWIGGAAPGTFDNAVINGATSVDLSGGSASVGTLTMGTTTPGTPGLSIGAGGSLTIQNGVIGESGGSATVTVSGQGATFTNTSELTIGRYGTGSLTVENGGHLVTRRIGLGTPTWEMPDGSPGGGSGTLVVSGSGTVWENTGGVDIARGSAETGSLTVSDGATARITHTGIYTGQGASILFTGAGTRVEIGDPNEPNAVGAGASGGWLSAAGGTITVSNGASLYTTGTYVGVGGSDLTTMTVTGQGTTLVGEHRIYVGGQNGGGDVNMTNGAGALYVTAGASAWGGSVGVGMDTNSQGRVEVSGSGSELWAKANSNLSLPTEGNFYIGYAGEGAVVVSAGGAVKADNEIRLAYGSANSIGTLVIGGDSSPDTAGTVTARNGIVFGAGDSRLVLNHTSDSYTLAAALISRVAGSGLIQVRGGSTWLTGDASRFSGNASVASGAGLGIAGPFGGNVMLAGDAALSVRGSISGQVQLSSLGGNTTLNIYNGAVFSQGIGFAGTTANTLNFYTGSYTLKVDDYRLADNTINLRGTAKTLITTGVDSNGDGNIVLVDSSSVAAVDRAASDVQRQVSGVLQDIMNLDVARPGPTLAPSAYASTDARPNPANLALKQTKDQAIAIDEAGNLAWMRAFMGARHQDGSDGLASTNGRQFGTLVGADHLFDDWRLGVYAGAGRSTTSLSGNLGSLDSDMALAGLYARRDLGAVSLDMALTGGHIWADSERGVNNGAETARGSFNGWFIAPEAALSLDYALNSSWKLTPSLRGRYVASFYDAFTESGSSQNINYDSHVSHSLEERFDTRLTYATVTGAGLSASAWVGAGVSATQRVGNGAYDASVSGVDFAIVATGDRNVYGATAAAGFDMMIGRSASLFGSVETTFATDDSRTGLVRGGVKIAF